MNINSFSIGKDILALKVSLKESICDNSQQKVPFMSIFERYEMFALYILQVIQLNINISLADIRYLLL